MTIRTGTWGFAKWGSAVWGRSLFGIPCSGNIISDALVNAITQDTASGQGLSASVTIDGVEASEFLQNLKVSTTAFGASRTAEITFAAESVTGLVLRKSIIELSISYVLGSDSFTATIFRGKPRTIKPAKSGAQKTVSVICFDMSRALDEAAPKFTTFTGSVQALIRQELLALGIEFIEFNWTDYNVSGLLPTNYPTVRALVNALINGKGKAYSSYDPDGIFRIYDATKNQNITWSIPIAGQTMQASKDKSSNVYNRVTASNGAGLSQTYNDDKHQVDNGLLETSVTCPFCTLNSELLAFATQFAKESQATQWELETPLNPFIQVGNRVGIETESGTGIIARDEEAQLTFSWPGGARHRLVCREIPNDIETIVVASPTTPIYDNKGYGWGGLFATDGDFTSYYPEFTVSREWAVRFLATQHQVGSPAGTLTLINVDTLAEIGPFTLIENQTPWDGYWHTYYVEPGFSLPAGTYRIVDSETASWLVSGDYSGMNPKGAIARIGGD
jgi:hypothetical protein